MPDQTSETVNTTVWKHYPCCTCCADSNCDRFVDQTVICSVCGFTCSCEGCVVEEPEHA